jgi:hypothetical protein
MKKNRGLMSAVMAIAMLAMPVAASAHSLNYYYRHGYYRNRIMAPAYNRMAPIQAYNRPFMANTAPMMPAPGYYNYRPGYAMAPGYAAAPMMPAAPCAGGYNMAPAYNYATPSYGYGSPGYGAGMPGGLANMVRARDNAEMMYGQALRNGNGNRAHHLGLDVAQLNKNIANTRRHDGFGARYGSFNPTMAGGYGNSYGYGNSGYGNSGFGSLAPFLGNFMH